MLAVNTKLLTFRWMEPDRDLTLANFPELANILKITGLTAGNQMGANSRTNCTGTYGGKPLGGTLKTLVQGQDYELNSGVFGGWILQGAKRVRDLTDGAPVDVPQALTYQMEIPVAGTVSAGMYHPVTDVQVRELLANVPYLGGVTQELWDGNDDFGQPVSDPLSYIPKYVINPLVDGLKGTFERCLGNTSPLSGPGKIRSAHFLSGMVEVGDYLYWAVSRCEGTAQSYLKSLKSNPSYQLEIGDHREHSVFYICTDKRKVYRAGFLKEYSSFCTATDCENGDADVQFQFGTRFDESNCTFYAINVQRDGDVVTGSAVQQAGNLLFFAHGKTNQVRVFNKTTGQYLRTWPATGIREIALLDDNTMVGIRNGTIVEKYTLDANGTGTAVGLAPLAGLVEPMAIAVKPAGAGFSVIDGSLTYDPATTARHCVRHYTPSGQAAGVFGLGEGYAVDTTVRDDKFNFCCLHTDPDFGIGKGGYGTVKPSLMYQANGDLRVGDIGHFRYQHFSSTGAYIDQIAYLGYNYSVAADPKSPRRVFAGFLEFDAQTGKLVRDWSAGWNPGYDDQEKRMRYVTTSPDGSVTYCLLQSQNRSNSALPLMFVELPAVGTLRYTQVFTEHYNCALNADFTLTSETFGVIGQPQERSTRTVTVDANRNPVLGPKTLLEKTPVLTITSPVTEGGGLNCDQYTLTGRMFTFSSDMPDEDGNGRGGNGPHVGVAKDGQWKALTAYTTHRKYQAGYPLDGKYDLGLKVQKGGTILQVFNGRLAVWGFKGEFRDGTQTNKYAFVLDNGLQAGGFGVANSAGSPEPHGSLGLASNALTFRVVKDGEDWWLYHADEGFQAGIGGWRIKGADKLIERQATLALADQPASNRLWLNEGLAYNVSLAPGEARGVRSPEVDAPPVRGAIYPARIATGLYVTDRHRPEVTVEQHPQSNGEPPVFKQWDLGPLPGNLSSWVLEGLFNSTNFDPANAPNEFHGLRVYDDQGRVILDAKKVEVAFLTNYQMQVNFQEANRLPIEVWNRLNRYLQKLRCMATRDGFLWQFAGLPPFLCTRCADPLANWQRPTTLELRCQSATNREGVVSADLDFIAS